MRTGSWAERKKPPAWAEGFEVRLRQGEGLRLDAALPDKGGKMGTAGQAGLPGQTTRRAYTPPREPEPGT